MVNGKPDRAAKQPRPSQRLLTGKQAEIEYGPPYRTLYDLHVRGLLPAVRLGRRLWFERTAIETLIHKSRERGSPA